MHTPQVEQNGHGVGDLVFSGAECCGSIVGSGVGVCVIGFVLDDLDGKEPVKVLLGGGVHMQVGGGYEWVQAIVDVVLLHPGVGLR